MKKSNYYRCLVDSDGKVTAKFTAGYREWDIGLHKEGRKWIATHIPTGMEFLTNFSYGSRKTLLERVKKFIAEKENFDEIVLEHKKGYIYQSFLKWSPFQF